MSSIRRPSPVPLFFSLLVFFSCITTFHSAAAASSSSSILFSATDPTSLSSSLSSTAFQLAQDFSTLLSHVLDLFSYPSSLGAKPGAGILASEFSKLASEPEPEIDPNALTSSSSDTEADVFVPYVARQVEPSVTPVIQDPTFCTFPEPFRGTSQRIPRNNKFFRRVRDGDVIRFNIFYKVTDGVATIRVRTVGSSLVFRRIGVIVRLGKFRLRRAGDIPNREWISRGEPRGRLYEQRLFLSGVTALRRAARSRSCCQEILTVNVFARICRQTTGRRGFTRLSNCTTRLVQPRPARFGCQRV